MSNKPNLCHVLTITPGVAPPYILRIVSEYFLSATPPSPVTTKSLFYSIPPPKMPILKLVKWTCNCCFKCTFRFTIITSTPLHTHNVTQTNKNKPENKKKSIQRYEYVYSCSFDQKQQQSGLQLLQSARHAPDLSNRSDGADSVIGGLSSVVLFHDLVYSSSKRLHQVACPAAPASSTSRFGRLVGAECRD